MVTFTVTKRFLQEFASNVAPMYFGVRLSSAQARDFASKASREISSLEDLKYSLDAYISRLMSDYKTRGGLK